MTKLVLMKLFNHCKTGVNFNLRLRNENKTKIQNFPNFLPFPSLAKIHTHTQIQKHIHMYISIYKKEMQIIG